MSQIIVVLQDIPYGHNIKTIRTKYGLFASKKEAHRALIKKGWKPNHLSNGNNRYNNGDLSAYVKEINFDIKPTDELP